MKRDIPTFIARDGTAFWYTLPDPLLQYQHELDRRIGGTLKTQEPLTRDAGQRFIQTSIMEEAITSSQLEGAATTRRVAKEMIRSGRRPQTAGERMIANNYRTMLHIRERTGEPLSLSLIEDVHRALTNGVTAEPVTNTRLQTLCDFVNAPEHSHFMHPVVKAIILHFWLAYIHPFQDGNGRTARALFYWFLLKQGFWIAEYVSISRILRKAPARYGKSFLYTETDENDLTYFILSQMNVLVRSVEDLFEYLTKKSNDIQAVSKRLLPGSGYNHRQLALLSHALRHPRMVYTIESHRRSHGVVYQTARTDLLQLAQQRLLRKSTQGRTFIFTPVSDLADRLKKERR